MKVGLHDGSLEVKRGQHTPVGRGSSNVRLRLAAGTQSDAVAEAEGPFWISRVTAGYGFLSADFRRSLKATVGRQNVVCR
jgi:hypothetical protein